MELYSKCLANFRSRAGTGARKCVFWEVQVVDARRVLTWSGDDFDRGRVDDTHGDIQRSFWEGDSLCAGDPDDGLTWVSPHLPYNPQRHNPMMT
jgi:hypothetical protein